MNILVVEDDELVSDTRGHNYRGKHGGRRFGFLCADSSPCKILNPLDLKNMRKPCGLAEKISASIRPFLLFHSAGVLGMRC
jgi:hypothetical protein